MGRPLFSQTPDVCCHDIHLQGVSACTPSKNGKKQSDLGDLAMQTAAAADPVWMRVAEPVFAKKGICGWGALNQG